MMNDEHRQKLIDRYEEASITLMMDEYAESDGARLLREYEAAQKNGGISEIPADLDAKCRQLIQDTFVRDSRNAHFTRLFKAVGKAAVFVFLFIGLTAATVLSVEALRVPVLNFFMQHHDKYTSLTTYEPRDDEQIQEDIVARMLEVPVPDGYTLEKFTAEEEGSLSILYKNEEDCAISMEAAPSTTMICLDTEDSTIEKVGLFEYDAFFVKKEGLRIVWSDAENLYTFSIYANGLDENTFWQLVYRLAE